MKQQLLSALMATALVAGIAAMPAESAGSVLQPTSHCVAYKTRKTQALIANSDIVGTNCNVTVKAVKAANGNLSAEISVPIAGFNSRERDRDVEVAKLLKASTHPTLTIRTAALTPAQWQTLLKNGSGTVKGQLVIGGRSYTISTTPAVRKVGAQIVVSGVIVTRFTAFGITPPEVGPGGVIAKAPDYLELHYNFLSSKVQNLAVVPK